MRHAGAPVPDGRGARLRAPGRAAGVGRGARRADRRGRLRLRAPATTASRSERCRAWRPSASATSARLSKRLAPGLSLGWMLAPSWLSGALTYEKGLADGGSPVLEQLALADFLARGELDRHLRRMRLRLPGAPIRAVGRGGAAVPGARVSGVPAGLYVLISLPDGVDEEALVSAAAAEGVGVEALSWHRAHRAAATPRARARLRQPLAAGDRARRRSARAGARAYPGRHGSRAVRSSVRGDRRVERHRPRYGGRARGRGRVGAAGRQGRGAATRGGSGVCGRRRAGPSR